MNDIEKRRDWAHWFCQENYELIRLIRKIGYGEVRVEVHESIPVFLFETLIKHKLKVKKNAANS